MRSKDSWRDVQREGGGEAVERGKDEAEEEQEEGVEGCEQQKTN